MDILSNIGSNFMPMISLSWDRMLGLNVGLGASSGQDMFIGMSGPYVYTNFALTKPGLSVSAGHYITVLGMTSMRNGLTYIAVQDSKYEGSYIGIENSMTHSPFILVDHTNPLYFVGGYYRVSALTNLNSGGLLFNGAVGLGVF